MTSTADHILKKYYEEDSLAYNYLYKHSISVTKLAIRVAENNPELEIDMDDLFIAAMLHDIGIFKTYAPKIGCFGTHPYIAHGYLGREILEENGLIDIAPVCERHVGVGITLNNILEQNLPLPHREMIPVTNIEKIVCYADKFYSKKPKYLINPKPIDVVRLKISKHGPEHLKKFNEMIIAFGSDFIYE